jgi:hypothetical protein
MPNTSGIALGGAASSLLASRELDIREQGNQANSAVALGNLALAQNKQLQDQRNDLRKQMITDGVVPFVTNVQAQIQGLIDNGVNVNQPRYQEFISKRKAFAARVLGEAVAAGVATQAEAQTFLSSFDAMAEGSVVSSRRAAEQTAKGEAVGQFRGEQEALESTPIEQLPGVPVHAIMTDGSRVILEQTDKGFRHPDTKVRIPGSSVAKFAENPEDLDNDSSSLSASVSNSIRSSVRNQLGFSSGPFGAITFIGDPEDDDSFIQNVQEAQALEGPVASLAEQYFLAFGGSMGTNGAAQRALTVVQNAAQGREITNEIDIKIIQQAALSGAVTPALAGELLKSIADPDARAADVPQAPRSERQVPEGDPRATLPTQGQPVEAPIQGAPPNTAPDAAPVTEAPVGQQGELTLQTRLGQVAELFTSDEEVPTRVNAKFEALKTQLEEQVGGKFELSGESISGEDLARVEPGVGPEAVGNGRAYAVWRRDGPGKLLVGLILDDDLAGAVGDQDNFAPVDVSSGDGPPGVRAARATAITDEAFDNMIAAWLNEKDANRKAALAEALAVSATTKDRQNKLNQAIVPKQG